MKKNDEIFLRHILEEIEKVNGFIKDLTKNNFLMSPEKQYATIRGLEIIGEATRNLSKDFRRKHGNVPWKYIAGMRNKLIHRYFDIDLDITWKAIRKDLPDLKEKIEKILEDTEKVEKQQKQK